MFEAVFQALPAERLWRHHRREVRQSVPGISLRGPDPFVELAGHRQARGEVYEFAVHKVERSRSEAWFAGGFASWRTLKLAGSGSKAGCRFVLCGARRARRSSHGCEEIKRPRNLKIRHGYQ